MATVIYPITEVPVVTAYFPEGRTVTIEVRDLTGAIIPITSNVVSASIGSPTVYRWDFANIITPPTEGNGLVAYLEMTDTGASPYSPYREVFRWGELAGYESALGYFPEGSNVTIKIFDNDGVELPVVSDVCAPLANDPKVQYWGFSNLITYPANGFKGHWTMSIDDDSYPDVSEDYEIWMQPLSNFRVIKAVKLLKAEYCLYEPNFQILKARVTFPEDNGNYFQQQSFSARIINKLGFIWELTDWSEQIDVSVTKVIKEVDLTTITFIDGNLPLNIGDNILETTYGEEVVQTPFKMVPITVETMKSQYLLGIELESSIQLSLQQDLRLITGIEVLEISKETSVGAKELVWDVANSTLQWDDGEPILITDENQEYHILNYMSSPGIVDGDWLHISIDDIDNLPAESKTETVIVDVKKYGLSDFQYWIDNGYRVVTELMIMTDIEPTLYSSDRDLVAEGYKFLDPVLDLPKNFSETTNYSFEFPVNMLQYIVELWAQYFANDSRININKSIITHSTDGQVVIRLYPYALSNSGGGSNAITFGQAGIYDRSMYAKTHHGARNKTKNFWNGTVVAGITDKNVQSLALTIAGMVGAMDLLIQAGLGTGAGIASRSFSVGGISSSYNSTESAENSRYSGILLDMQKKLGIGKSTKDEQKTGLVQSLKNKVLGSSLSFKY